MNSFCFRAGSCDYLGLCGFHVVADVGHEVDALLPRCDGADVRDEHAAFVASGKKTKVCKIKKTTGKIRD